MVRPVETILRALEKAYPQAHCALAHDNPFELLVATVLSAQCTDKRVNQVTPLLFARYPEAASLAQARQSELEKIIYSTGFYRNKAKHLIAMAKALMALYGGQVPADMKALVALPGVGRKTANVVLGNAFGIAGGVVVDTHVGRIARLLGLTKAQMVEKVEADLIRCVPRSKWILLPHLLIEHGRQICVARRPRCGQCVLATNCPSCLI